MPASMRQSNLRSAREPPSRNAADVRSSAVRAPEGVAAREGLGGAPSEPTLQRSARVEAEARRTAELFRAVPGTGPAAARGVAAVGGGVASTRPGPAVVQRAVGFEFEVQGTNLWTGPAEPEELGRKLLTYGTRVHDGADYHVESDDGRMEFVTKPFPETVGGLERLGTAVGSAANFLLKGWSQTTPNQPTTTLGAITGKDTEPAGSDANPRVGYFKDPSMYPGNPRVLWAKPQCSLAIPLGRLAALAKRMSVPDTRTQVGRGLTATESEGEQEAEASWGEAFLGLHEELASGFKTARPSKAVLSFVTLLALYIQEAEQACEMTKDEPQKKVPMRYPKGAHTLMARTNFRVMFDQLKAEWPSSLGTRKLLYPRIEALAGRAVDTALYPLGYVKDSAPETVWGTLEAFESEYHEPGPTIEEWLNSVFPSESLTATAEGTAPESMQGRVAPHLPSTPEGRGMGAMKKGESVKSRSKRSKAIKSTAAPIFEFRGFEGPVPPERWISLAEAVFKTAHLVNAKEQF